MKRRSLLLLTAVVLVLTSLLRAALTTGQSSGLKCAPYVNVTETQSVQIEVAGEKHLQGKFIYPAPINHAAGVYFDPLPAIAMTHGIADNFSQVEAKAQKYAHNCFVVLIWNYRGQGLYTGDIETEFTLHGDLERDDLVKVTTTLKNGPTIPVPPPGSGYIDLVDETHLGIMGVSQGGQATWLAIADYDTRGNYQAAIPADNGAMMSQMFLPQDCISAGLSAMFQPSNLRTPGPTTTVGATTPTSTPDVDGILWEPTLQAQLANAYLNSTPDVPALQSVFATRDPSDELAVVPTQTGTPGTPVPYPHVQGWASYYDHYQWTDETIAGVQTITPVPTYSSYPNTSLYLSKGNAHTGPLWEASTEEKNEYNQAQVDLLHAYLGPFYASTLTPTPDWTPGASTPTPTHTPTPVPAAVVARYIVDSFDPANASLTPVPTFATVASSKWPTVTPNNVQLYLHNDGAGNGDLNLNTPAVETPDRIGQDYTAGATPWTIGTAVAEATGQTPAFNTWASHIDLSGLTVVYISPALTQDVTLIGPPKVQLYAAPDASYGTNGYPFQVHVRIGEQLDDDPQVAHFITRANACAWTVSDISWFQGTEYTGETRVHTFKSGSRIRLELTTVDKEEYDPSALALFMTPHLGEMRVNIYHHKSGAEDKSTNVTLPLQLSNPNCSNIFQSCAGAPEGVDSQTEAKPELPTALTIAATLWPADTNPGDWRAWAPEVWITCSGGEGAVNCPADTYLATDGANQSFTFTATDAAGHTASATLSGINIDRTPPSLSETLPESQTFCSGSTTQLDFAASDALSGLADSWATFNNASVQNRDVVTLQAGTNVLQVNSRDAAGNFIINQATLQVNYNTTLDFPTDGGQVNPLLPLSFAFQVNDACAAQGWYNGAAGALWLISPGGVEQPAEWYGIATGNSFVLNSLTGWYDFDADLTGLAAGTWTARADLDDGTSRSVTFVIPAAGTPSQSLPLAGGGLGWGFDCAADLARNGRYLGGCR